MIPAGKKSRTSRHSQRERCTFCFSMSLARVAELKRSIFYPSMIARLKRKKELAATESGSGKERASQEENLAGRFSGQKILQPLATLQSLCRTNT